jgi:hypothetical protein
VNLNFFAEKKSLVAIIAASETVQAKEKKMDLKNGDKMDPETERPLTLTPYHVKGQN